MALAEAAGEAVVAAGVEVAAALAAAEECPAAEAPADHGDDEETTAEIHRRQRVKAGDRTGRRPDIGRDRGVGRSFFLGQCREGGAAYLRRVWVSTGRRRATVFCSSSCRQGACLSFSETRVSTRRSDRNSGTPLRHISPSTFVQESSRKGWSTESRKWDGNSQRTSLMIESTDIE